MATSRTGFDPVFTEDADGSEVRVSTTVDADWQPCVKLTCRAEMTFDRASNYLSPDQARSVARALLDAADATDLAAFGCE